MITFSKYVIRMDNVNTFPFWRAISQSLSHGNFVGSLTRHGLFSALGWSFRITHGCRFGEDFFRARIRRERLAFDNADGLAAWASG